MSKRPEAINVTKMQRKEIVKYFKEDAKDAHKISSWTLVPRHQVMAVLEQEGLRTYSPGSYA